MASAYMTSTVDIKVEDTNYSILPEERSRDVNHYSNMKLRYVLRS